MRLNEDFLLHMREATRVLQQSGPQAATAAIQRALQGQGAGDAATAPATVDGLVDINPVPGQAPMRGNAARHGFREQLREVADAVDAHKDPSTAHESSPAASSAAPRRRSSAAQYGKFIGGSCVNRAGARQYRLYVPSAYQGEPLPMVVMLHGCKQDAEDFAAGTGMNRVAEANNCFVLYPEQARAANGSSCWNWFQGADQQRDAGEPSIIADMTRQLMREYCVDPERVYIAGLSAGAAMATIVASAYPELYAAVGMHSGLPAGAAHDMPSAFGAMSGKAPATGGRSAKPRSHARHHVRPVPVIVFHGDRDLTVNPGNGSDALTQCMGGPGAHAGEEALHASRVIQAKVPNGRSYTRTIYQARDGIDVAEHWTIHGAGHAWSGGSHSGSYTDPTGPDASAEMLRFFCQHRNRPA